jgi:cytochrome c oxidase cbb3-type subunit 2/cytochrome c oxidase cbb3-type subunit I/II
MNLQMTPSVTVVGSFLALMGVIAMVVFLPAIEDQTEPSDIWQPLDKIEQEGRQLYIENGCQYCHSMYIRAQDWDFGHNRVSQAGDYYGEEPILFGSERQGPDLSQEGGLRSDDWHYAHFYNPRYTRPESIMPQFSWMTEAEIRKLTRYVQSLGGKDADQRMERQYRWKAEALKAYYNGKGKAGGDDPIENMKWLHTMVPKEWMDLPNPYPADEPSLKRGEKIYLNNCIGCHGPVGDGMGPAARFMDPPPFNFTYLTRWTNEMAGFEDRDPQGMAPIGGMLYYQIMNGITGTTMPPFKTELESEKIWDVSNYVAVKFAGRKADMREMETMPRSIPSSFEPVRGDEYAPEERDEEEQKEDDGGEENNNEDADTGEN